METKQEHYFSAFHDKCSKQPHTCTLKQVMDAIIGGTWKQEVLEIRGLQAAGKGEEAAAKKARLMYITYSGVFEGGHKATQLKEYSQYVIADFDDVEPERLDEYLAKLKEVPCVAAAFDTPSLGLKAAVLVDSDATHHKSAYKQAMAVLEAATGLKTDDACSDICRGHFVSYSPHGWYRDEVTPLHIAAEAAEEPAPVPPKKAPRKGGTGKGGIPPLTGGKPGNAPAGKAAAGQPERKMLKPVSPKDAARLMSNGMAQLNERMSYTLHQRNEYVYQLMCYMNRKGVDRETATLLAASTFDLSTEEINRTVNSAYTHTEEFGKEWEHEKTQVELIEEYLDGHFVLRRNVVLCQLEYLRAGDREENWCPMTDYEENSILRELLLHSFKVKANLLHNILNSDYVHLFDPFQSYMDSLPAWDGATDYLGQLAATVTTTNQEAFDKDFRKWMVATVAGWLMKDVCNETVLAFSGPQGSYKTTFLCNLIPPQLHRYSDSITGIPATDDKDARMKLAQCGIINLEEVEALNHHEQAQFKSMLTVKSINERPAYARNKEVMPRRAAFTASTNQEEVINDTTGGRRWVYAQVVGIKSPYGFTFPYEGMYAQAYALLKGGFQYWYDSKETVDLNRRNEAFRAVSVEEEQLAVCFRRPEEWENYDLLTASQIMERMMMFLHITMSRVNLGRALKAAGYESVWRNGVKIYKVKQLDATDIEINKHKK